LSGGLIEHTVAAIAAMTTEAPPPNHGSEDRRRLPFENTRTRHSSVGSRGNPEVQDDDDPNDETPGVVQTPQASQFALDVLIWDALLGVAIGVLVVIAFALIFKSLQWLVSG
jgi:hypothetical protein